VFTGRIQLSSLKNHISRIWHRFGLKFGALIGLWVRNPKQLSLHQFDFCSSIYSSRNGRRSIFTDCEIWLWRLRFSCSSLFYFLALDVQKGMDVSFLMPLKSLHFRPLELMLCTKHRLKVKSVNYLQFTHFCIFHPKVPSKHKTENVKAFYIWNIEKTLVKCGWNYWIILLHQSLIY
jgi:hypothetical protein